ncbi:dihydrolipoyllysine-residue succinyltransferase [Akkermansiaceae bacterium]|nr:dihydrolipoyllysine-residue succinyltransferase [Akkermansiaceae bacterium]MDB4732123.1 dihydrolipoyllysine-residue succinyltransferase [bacterium]MDB4259347.1 dihydrolipoyllysine-residue succinyltransferase [Akkermansiaceae bacterium]MDB4296491.1 dihydrolipoyllysine-residue succinyltransferase [Akkermansiaceae bacterium]MDB4318873.1 dihydrolipoyllysine-residue succinyltransferase [Akkermansiaceae bacterium]
MSHEIKIPPVGESVTSALVARWHKGEGDSVQKGETLVTLETDKVSNELEAEVSGTLSITVPEGEEVEIGTVVGSIAEDAVSESAPDPQAVGPAQVASSDEKGEVVPIKVPAAGDSITSATVAAWAVADGSFVNKGDVMVTLDTDKVSSELEAEASGTIKIEVSEGEEVDIGATLGTLTTGSAPVSASIPQPAAAPEKVAPAPEKKSAPAPVAKPVPAKTEEGRVTRKKMTPLRRKIAQHLVNAQQTAAILTTFNEADMSAVMKLRKQVQEDFIAKHGVKLGFMSFFVKAVVQALKEVPSINARIDGTDVIQNHFFDIGVAIGTEKGLVVPVLRDCDKKSFAQIEQDILDYAFKARDGKIGFDDLSGGVFTVSNGGVYGSLLSTPILNPPQSGILGMHTIQQRPMAVNEEVKILPMMYLAMSYDHRLVDGKEAVTFLISIKNSIENPTRLMLEM